MAGVRLVAVAALCLRGAGAAGRDLQDKIGVSLRNKAPDRTPAQSSESGAGQASAGPSSPRERQAEVLQQHLYICNAYTSSAPLDVYHVQTLVRLTEGAPLKYKECRDIVLALAEGDQLDFKAGNVDAGTFYASGLPKTEASLLLIPHRRDGSDALSFESHAFTETQNSQIAVVDAYHGDEEGAVTILDELPEGETTTEPVEEMLQFSTVVAVNPGNYKVMLSGGGENPKTPVGARTPLRVEDQSNYVVMRVGNSNSTQGSFPQELVVFPKSGAMSLTLGLISFIICALTVSLSA